MEESFSKQDVRTVMKFLFLQGKRPPEMHRELEGVFKDNAPSEQTVRKWFRLFQEGRTSVEDNERSGRPLEASSPDVVQQVEMLLAEDRRQTCKDLAERADISAGSIHTILHRDLDKQKKFSKWVPKLLTEEQRNVRATISRSHLRRNRTDSSFLERIVAGDETWVYSWDPETKAQSAEWRSPGSPRPQKAIRKQTSLKVMHIMFFDVHGVLLNWAVPPGTRVNGPYYQWVIREKLRPAIRRKRRQLLENGVILLHDNAPVHVTRSLLDMLDAWDWEVLQHPPYSPDLSPCDFFLFPQLKKKLRGIRFDTADEIENAVKEQVRRLDTEGVRPGIEGLLHRWQKCCELDGAYVE